MSILERLEYLPYPSRTVRADICSDIRKINYECACQIIRANSDIGSKPRSFIRITDIRFDIGVTNIRARSLL